MAEPAGILPSVAHGYTTGDKWTTVTIPWSIWDVITDTNPIDQEKNRGRLPAEHQAPHGMKYPPRMLRPATSIFTSAMFMLVVDPNHLVVMEDHEHVFLFTKFLISICIYIPNFGQSDKAKSNLRVRTRFRLPSLNTSMPLDLIFKQKNNQKKSLRCAGVVWAFFCSKIVVNNAPYVQLHAAGMIFGVRFLLHFWLHDTTLFLLHVCSSHMSLSNSIIQTK